MDVIIAIHRVFGQMVLPLLIVVAAIWFTISWKPDTPPTTVARLFPVLVDLQVTLGLIYFVYRLALGAGVTEKGGSYLGFPFLLHPILGILAAGVAHMAVKGGPLRGLGRWGALASLGLLLLIVVGNVLLALSA
jgi:hypothetical protein